jgi:RNA recognition motif-containing protein
MKKKLYVANLSCRTTEATLFDLFGTVGEVVSVNLVTDHLTGRSKGFAFVKMAKKRTAKRAINELNGKPVDGRIIKVEKAHPQQPREPTASWSLRARRHPPEERQLADQRTKFSVE